MNGDFTMFLLCFIPSHCDYAYTHESMQGKQNVLLSGT